MMQNSISMSPNCWTWTQSIPKSTRCPIWDISEKHISSIVSSKLEFSRIMAETSKTQEANFLSRGGNFGAFWIHKPKKAPIFKHFRHLQRKSLQIVAKAHFLAFPAQDLNYQELGPKLQRLKKLIFCLAEAILEHFELTGPKRHPFSSIFGICSEDRSR